MAKALHDYDSLNQRHLKMEEITKKLGEAKQLFKKRKLPHVELNFDRMVLRSLDHLDKFADEALRKIKSWRPDEGPPRADSL